MIENSILKKPTLTLKNVIDLEFAHPHSEHLMYINISHKIYYASARL